MKMATCTKEDEEMMCSRCQVYLGKEAGSIGNCGHFNRKALRRKNLVAIKHPILSRKRASVLPIWADRAVQGLTRKEVVLTSTEKKMESSNC